MCNTLAPYADDSSTSIATSCQKLWKLVDNCRRYSKPKQCSIRDTAWLNRHNFLGSCFPRSLPHSLSNISAKNYQNQSMCIAIIACCCISVVFWRHRVELTTSRHHIHCGRYHRNQHSNTFNWPHTTARKHGCGWPSCLIICQIW